MEKKLFWLFLKIAEELKQWFFMGVLLNNSLYLYMVKSRMKAGRNRNFYLTGGARGHCKKDGL